MKTLCKKALLGATLFLGSAFSLIAAAQIIPSAKVKQLTPNVWVYADEVKPANVAEFKAQGFTALVNFRPDGEVSDQASAASVQAAAKASKIAYAYSPVKNLDIPESAVNTLEKTLAENKGPVLIYCRSGRRAARVWSLAEASRPQGMSVAAIQTALKSIGQSADDLNEAITQRVAQRPKK